MAMMNVRFVGQAPAALFSKEPGTPSIQFSRYGQLIEMDDTVYRTIISGEIGSRLALLPEEEFAGIHTADELSKYANFESHRHASAEFISKVKLAHDLVIKNRTAADEAAKEVTPHA